MSFIREVRNDIEREAFRLIREYHAMLVNEARGLGADEQTAEDLAFKTIETYLAKRENELPPAEKLRSWLLGTIRNHYLHSVRGKARACTVYLDQSDVEKLQELGPVDNSTDEAILAHSDAEFVRNVLASLPEETRRVIVLHYFESLSIREIAALLARTPDSVKCNLYYARKVLAKRLGKALGRAALAIAALLFGGSLLYAAAVATGLAPSPFAADEESEVVFNAKNTKDTEGSSKVFDGLGEECLSLGSDPTNHESRATNHEISGGRPQQFEAITDNSETNNEENTMSNSMQKVSMVKALAAAAALTAGVVLAADPGVIEVVASNLGTGEFSLRIPASEKPLELYWAAAWADDTADYAQWRDPVFLTDVAAGTTEVNVTVPGFQSDATSRFFLADPANATVTRHEYHTGGKDGNGKYKSAFITGLHPNWDWRYELVFDVSEFSDHSWVLCHRKNTSNSGGSLLHFIVRNASDKRLRFGYATDWNKYSSAIVADKKYQATIDKNVFTVSNLTDNASFYTVSLATSTDDYATGYNLWFGASGGSDGKTYSTGDGCSFVRVHSFKAWNGSNELVGDFRPIVTNGVAGYFDLATRKFFESGDQSLGAEGTVVASGFEPYVPSATTRHIDTLVAHLGELVAVSTVLKAGPVECVSESIPFINGSIPNYGSQTVSVGGSVTFSVPTDEFIWTDASRTALWRVKSAGLRIDAYDSVNDDFVPGAPQPSLRSCTFTRQSASDGVRVVCLWDAEMIVDAPEGRRADCLRLVGVGTNDVTGLTEVGHGLFDTGIHPIPAATRVLFDVSIDNDNRSAQNTPSPVKERRFFGVRDRQLSAPARYAEYYHIARGGTPSKTFDLGMYNYLDGVEKNVQINNDSGRYMFDVNPTYTLVRDVSYGTEHLAELVGYSRSSEPLGGILHIFGQHRPDDATAPLCVDYNNTRYYSYTIWTNGEDLTRDYVPCLDAAGRPSFYDRVGKSYIYATGDKAEIVAEFGSYAGANSVQVTGENEKGEPAAYLDPGAAAPGYYKIAVGDSQTFTATPRDVFETRVVGYRVDTWVDGSGWRKGAVQSGRSVTLSGEDSIRRVVWIWKRVSGSAIYII